MNKEKRMKRNHTDTRTYMYFPLQSHDSLSYRTQFEEVI